MADHSATISEHTVSANGLEFGYLAAGEGPLALCLHGFPDTAWSWRHLLTALAGAGYRAVAPFMRGYAPTGIPESGVYQTGALSSDAVALHEALGGDADAVVIGHDWGAPTAWSCALHHPDRVTAVGALSVPFMPRSPVPPLDAMREAFKGQFFYQLYFQEPGVAEAEFERDIRTALRKFLVMGAGETDLAGLPAKSAGDDMLSSLPDPATLPPWLTEEDLSFYAAEFTRSGMRGPLNYYRNHNLTWELTAGAPDEITQPALFVAGAKDGVILMAAEALQALPERVPNLRVEMLIPEIGHWTQQEAPEAVNKALLKFLGEVSG
jgi:pimeloyl-ACP methyl ester carboxylesterase